MPEGRPTVPQALKRELFEEAGYRCAIPTCLSTAALQMAHIVPWAQVRTHDFGNMIVLCANDHFRFDEGQIPRQSIRTYKDNLGLVNNRYGDMEKRILRAFAVSGSELNTEDYLTVPGGLGFMFMFLEEDGLVDVADNWRVTIGDVPSHHYLSLTTKGIEFVNRLRAAQALA